MNVRRKPRIVVVDTDVRRIVEVVHVNGKVRTNVIDKNGKPRTITNGVPRG